jgi:hypothetical protein
MSGMTVPQPEMRKLKKMKAEKKMKIEGATFRGGTGTCLGGGRGDEGAGPPAKDSGSKETAAA